MKKNLKLLSLPRIRQTHDFDCGAAALQSVLAYYGIELRADEVMKHAGTSARHGTKISAIIKTAKKFGLKTDSREMTIRDLKNYINKKIPVIIALQAWTKKLTKKKKPEWENDWSDGHYAVAAGYDKNKIYFADPSSFNIVYLKYNELEKRWHDADSEGKKYLHHGIAIFGKSPKFNAGKIVHMD